MEDNITSKALSGDEISNIASSDSSEAVNLESQDNPEIAKVLSGVLGKDFESSEAALKSVKDTFKYVGAAGQYHEKIKQLSAEKGITKEEAKLLFDNSINNMINESAEKKQPQVESNEQLLSLQRQVEDMKFYDENPDLKQHKSLLEELRGTSGKSLSELAASDTIKGIIGKVQAHDEIEKSKSVLQSNSRLGKVTNKLAEAKTALSEGKVVVANNNAVSAVLDAYDI